MFNTLCTSEHGHMQHLIPSCKTSIMQLRQKFTCILTDCSFTRQTDSSLTNMEKTGGNFKLWPGQFNTPSFHPLIQNRECTKANCSLTSPGPSSALAPNSISVSDRKYKPASLAWLTSISKYYFCSKPIKSEVCSRILWSH